MRVVFPYIAQLHQIPHSLPLAAEIAQRHPEVDVSIAYISKQHLRFIRRLVSVYAPGARLSYLALRSPWLRVPGAGKDPDLAVPLAKVLTLFLNRYFFDQFDAIITPERTSLLLRRMGVSRPRFIWTRHGAGDRKVGFNNSVPEFDYVLLAGPKIEKRLLALNLIRPGDYCNGIYAKFDWIKKLESQPVRLFNNQRPVILFNPHFKSSLSSWPTMGRRVLEQLAESERFNVIFAPHIRLFNWARGRAHREFDCYRKLSHMHIDLGSEASVDMTYTLAADVYVGDVSSQFAEFLIRPRPCLFLNPRRIQWQTNPNYESWHLGPVTSTVVNIEEQLDNAIASHHDFEQRQREYFETSFGASAHEGSAARGSDAIVQFLAKVTSTAAARGLEQNNQSSENAKPT